MTISGFISERPLEGGTRQHDRCRDHGIDRLRNAVRWPLDPPESVRVHQESVTSGAWAHAKIVGQPGQREVDLIFLFKDVTGEYVMLVGAGALGATGGALEVAEARPLLPVCHCFVAVLSFPCHQPCGRRHFSLIYMWHRAPSGGQKKMRSAFV